jgi:hypothetical protein
MEQDTVEFVKGSNSDLRLSRWHGYGEHQVRETSGKTSDGGGYCGSHFAAGEKFLLMGQALKLHWRQAHRHVLLLYLI